MLDKTKSEVKKVKTEAVILYANGKACDAVKDMPRDFKRVLAYSAAWVKACKEYINAHQS